LDGRKYRLVAGEQNRPPHTDTVITGKKSSYGRYEGILTSSTPFIISLLSDVV
jgi:hypothetical protein